MRDEWTDQLSDYLDGELAGARRAAAEAHLAGCAACRGTLEELGRVRARARGLVDRAPERDLWPSIARELGIGGGRRGGRRLAFSIPELLAASLALVLGSAGAGWIAHRAPRGAASVTEPSAASAHLAWASDPHYDDAVAELRAALEQGRTSGRLDSATVRIITRNLAVLDIAITEARRALAADPGSAYLNHHLAATMQRKLELLRRATAIAALRT